MQPDRRAPEGTTVRPLHPGSRTGGAGGTTRDPLVGRVLDGRYRIESRIARGGMASVYEATDLRLHRTIAVKVMHGGLGDDEAFAARFVREARAAAGLSHPNIVNVYDQGDDDGTLYLAMELVRGHTLRDTIAAEAPLSPRRALALLEPVLAALSTAHRAGLVHRDVKPENVLIADRLESADHGGAQVVKVADFGLAKAVTAETQHTATGVLIGTVSYVAPELVVEGRSDARADVYAAGVILYELLTGRKPHAGDTPIQVAYQHVHNDVPAPSEAADAIPPYVDALVARATARNAELRFADAGVMLRQLRRVASALAEGLADDPELVEDLALPPGAVREPDLAAQAEPTRARLATRPQALAGASSGSASDYGTDASALPTVSVRPDRPGTADPHRSSARTQPPRVHQPRRRGGPLLLLALLLAVGVGVGAWWFGFARYTTTPGVLGETSSAARSTLESAGLTVELADPAWSDTVPKGRVLSTDPAGGERVLDHGTVTVTLSRGAEIYAVPQLAGKTLDEAQDAIGAIRMEYGDAVERWSETVPAGTVIGTDPKAGTRLRPGRTVDVVVSKGRQPIAFGSFVGRDAGEATATLQRRSLAVETTEEYSDDVAEGDVIDQTPESGPLFKGETVRLVVSKGPELVRVPDVTGQGKGSAVDDLERAGFKAKVKHYRPYFGLGFVMAQDDAGEKRPKGDTITIYVS